MSGRDTSSVQEELIVRALCYLYCEAVRHRKPTLADAIEAAIAIGHNAISRRPLASETADDLRQVTALKGFAALDGAQKQAFIRLIERGGSPPLGEDT